MLTEGAGCLIGVKTTTVTNFVAHLWLVEAPLLVDIFKEVPTARVPDKRSANGSDTKSKSSGTLRKAATMQGYAGFSEKLDRRGTA